LRRGGVERGPAALRQFEPLAADQPALFRGITPAIPPAGDALLLQQRWQFVWRTADPPRAPSFRV
jgi:hypothetical protein